MPFSVESHFTPSRYAITGNAHVHEGGSNTPPTSILHTGQPAIVHFTWRQSGWLSNLLSGHWHCNVYFEKMGPGEGPSIPGAIEMFRLGEGHNYSAVVNISNVPEGVYKVVATLILYSNNNHTTPLHSFDELGVIQVVSDSIGS